MSSIVSTQVQVANLALNILRNDEISSFSDGTKQANIINSFYELAVRNALELHEWRFAMGEQQASLLASTTVPQWEYSYQLPSDMLDLKAVYTSNIAGDRIPYQNYAMFENNVLCTDTGNGIWVYYKKRVFESRWPTHFVTFFMYYLATMIAPMLGSQLELQQILQAQSDDLYLKATDIDTRQYPIGQFNASYLASERMSY
jgi:hypothetical protein